MSSRLNMQLRLKLADLLEQERQHHRFDLATSHVIRTERSEKTSSQAIVNMFASWFEDMGLMGCSSHSGRRTFITSAAREDQHGRRVFAGCSGIGRAFIVGCHAALYRGGWEAARAKVVELV